jgi:hypothetical protein
MAAQFSGMYADLDVDDSENNSMAEPESSLSGSRSYQELSEYWDTHSLADHWDQTSAVEFEMDVKFSAM